MLCRLILLYRTESFENCVIVMTHHVNKLPDLLIELKPIFFQWNEKIYINIILLKVLIFHLYLFTHLQKHFILVLYKGIYLQRCFLRNVIFKRIKIIHQSNKFNLY